MYNQYMKAVSVHLSETAYQEMKSVAARRGRPVAELIRQAMEEFLTRQQETGVSVLDLASHRSGKTLRGWDRSELLDEMLSS